MNWKKKLLEFEQNKKWDEAIAHMQCVIAEDRYNCDAYISMLYLLMNLLVEEDYDNTKHDYYAGLAKKYFDESYILFHENPEYLFYAAVIAFMSEWYFDIEIEEARKMCKKTINLEPNNILYQWGYYAYLNMSDSNNIAIATHYAQLGLNDHSIEKLLKQKGSLGEYIFGIIKTYQYKAKQY